VRILVTVRLKVLPINVCLAVCLYNIMMLLCRYRSLGIEGTRTAMSTFYLQLDLMTFFDLYHSGNHDRAYSV